MIFGINSWGSRVRVVSTTRKKFLPVDTLVRNADMFHGRTKGCCLGHFVCPMFGPHQGPLGRSLGSPTKRFDHKYVCLDFRVIPADFGLQTTNKTCKYTLEHTCTSKG